MPSFQQTYCVRERCSPQVFVDQVLRATLPWHANVLQPLIALFNPRHFAIDRELVAAVGRAETVGAVRGEIRTFVGDPANRSWLRRSAKVRVSTRRLLKLARTYLPDEKR